MGAQAHSVALLPSRRAVIWGEPLLPFASALRGFSGTGWLRGPSPRWLFPSRRDRPGASERGRLLPPRLSQLPRCPRCGVTGELGALHPLCRGGLVLSRAAPRVLGLGCARGWGRQGPRSWRAPPVSSHTLSLLLLFAPFPSIRLSHPVPLASGWRRPRAGGEGRVPSQPPSLPPRSLPPQAGGVALPRPSPEASDKAGGRESSVALCPAARARRQVSAGTVGTRGWDPAALHPSR